MDVNEITREMREVGARAVVNSANDEFGNGVAGFQRAELVAVAAYLAMTKVAPVARECT